MYDLHTHSYMSDGVLDLAELARRCQVQGYRGLAISDHCDHADIEDNIARVRRFCEAVRGCYGDMTIVPGCEITHVPPRLIGGLIEKAREMGAAIVLVHGETIVEPVAEGTNRAAIEGRADAVAHPGLITPEDAALAAKNGVLLEVSGRQGHCYTNAHVARTALAAGAKLSFGSDGHDPGEYPDRAMAEKIMRGAGLEKDQIQQIWRTLAALFKERA